MQLHRGALPPLHRALRRDGHHVFCIPVLPGKYAADFEPSREKATKEFGQFDHVRRFGAEDLRLTLGMVFPLPEEYDLEKDFDAGVLDAASIPPQIRRGWHPHNVLVMRKTDFKLTG